MSSQEAVDLGDVHPLQQVRIRRLVGPAVGCDPAHPTVDAAHLVDGALRIVGRTERRHRQECARPRQPAPRVTAVVGVLGHAGHRQRVQRLQQQRPQPADEHRRIRVHLPDRPVLGEPARAGRLVDAGAVLGPLRTRHHPEQRATHPRADGPQVVQSHTPGYGVAAAPNSA